jgi:antitoxin ParD1/3/4
MDHTTVNISMPKPMGRWIKLRIVRGGYGNASEYFRDLVRKDQKVLTQGEIESQLLAALRDGKDSPLTADDWAQARRKVHEQIARKQKARHDH